MKKTIFSVLLVLAILGQALSAAEAPAVTPEARLAAAMKLADSLKPQSGEIIMGDGIAKATLPAQLKYLNPADTETVLTRLWGNPKSGRTLGMLVPADFNALADDSWAVVVTFEEDGYVKDDDAAHMDFTKLLAEMKEGVQEASKERVKEGHPPIELVGWASPPRYDAVEKKLYWAKELKFGNSAEHTLNYNLRLLGRRGVLVLNAVAAMNQLKLVEQATPSILAAVNFQEGHRYADFKEDTDKVATYGLAALVAGGVAAKVGLFKGLWIALLAAKKFIILGVIALASSFKKLWARFRNRDTVAALPSDSTPPSS